MIFLALPWWYHSILIMILLFFTLILAIAYVNLLIKKSKLTSFVVKQSISDTIALSLVSNLDPDFDKSQILYSTIDRVVSNLFIIISLSGALSYLISNIPGFNTPLWYNLVILGFTYGTAVLFYFYIQNFTEF